MRLILKLIAAPLILFLTVLVAVLLFLFSVSSFLLTAASIIMVLLGVGLFFISYPVGGVIYLGIAFLLSPFGLQAVAGAVITGLNSLTCRSNWQKAFPKLVPLTGPVSSSWKAPSQRSSSVPSAQAMRRSVSAESGSWGRSGP